MIGAPRSTVERGSTGVIAAFDRGARGLAGVIAALEEGRAARPA